jgi:hypothetical protein
MGQKKRGIGMKRGQTIALIAGAAVGVSLVAAAGVYLARRENREMLAGQTSEMTKRARKAGESAFKTAREQYESVAPKAREAVSSMLAQAPQAVETISAKLPKAGISA